MSERVERRADLSGEDEQLEEMRPRQRYKEPAAERTRRIRRRKKRSKRAKHKPS